MPPTSFKCQYYKELRGMFEADCYVQFASIACFESTEAISNDAIVHLEKARAIYILLGMKAESKLSANKIYIIRAAAGGTNSDEDVATSIVFNNTKSQYYNSLESFGLTSQTTMRAGLRYVKMLEHANHTIEAERLHIKIATSSQRVHGPEHDCTLCADDSLAKCQKRYVIVVNENKPFQALQYVNDGELCIVTGPITKPRSEDDERTFHVDSDLIFPDIGCPVICHGLVPDYLVFRVALAFA